MRVNADYDECPYNFRAFEVSHLGDDEPCVTFTGHPAEAYLALLKWKIDNGVEHTIESSSLDHLSMDAPDLGWEMGTFEHNGNTYEAELLIKMED